MQHNMVVTFAWLQAIRGHLQRAWQRQAATERGHFAVHPFATFKTITNGKPPQNCKWCKESIAPRRGPKWLTQSQNPVIDT